MQAIGGGGVIRVPGRADREAPARCHDPRSAEFANDIAAK